MERRRGRPNQARACRPADPAIAGPVRARRLPALRARQMVSGRIPAALDVLALLAARRRTHLAKSRRIAAEGEQTGASKETAEACLARSRPSLGSRPTMSRRLTRIQPSGSSRRPICRRTSRRRTPAEGPRGATPHRSRFLARADRAFGICPARPALAGAGQWNPVAQREMEDPSRRAPSRARRQPCRLPFAARAPCPTCLRPRSPMSSKPIRPSHAGHCRISTLRGSTPSGSPRSRRRRIGPERVEQRLGDIDGAVRTAVTVEPRDGRLCVSCLRSSGSRIISNCRSRRSGGRESRASGAYRGLAASGVGACDACRSQVPGGDRSQHPSLLELARCVATTEAIYARRRAARLGADKFMIDGKHAGTGAGQSMSCRARRRSPVRFSAVRPSKPHLLAGRRPELELLLLGLFIGPPARRRVSTKRVTIVCMS